MTRHRLHAVAPAWEAGWLPALAAARAMNITPGELHAAVRAGAIRTRAIGPGATLYQVWTKEMK